MNILPEGLSLVRDKIIQHSATVYFKWEFETCSLRTTNLYDSVLPLQFVVEILKCDDRLNEMMWAIQFKYLFLSSVFWGALFSIFCYHIWK